MSQEIIGGKVLLVCLMAFLVISNGSVAAAKPSDHRCDFCGKQINSLDEPVSLVGTWLFTRKDVKRNKDPATDTSDWVIAKAPGPWKKIYPDDKKFRIGWYRGSFEFSPDLIGEEVVLLIDTYVARLKVYLDGEQIYSRGKNTIYKRYYGIQPVPVRFQVTKTRHVITFRVNTTLMVGVYQLPFQLRKYDPTDPLVGFSHWWGGEFRTLVSHVIFAIGGFFLLIFIKTRKTLYLISALTLIGTYPFYAFPGDLFLSWFDPEPLLTLHYIGILALGLFPFLFAQFFYKFYPRANVIHSIIHVILLMMFIYLAVDFHMEAFHRVRVSVFIYELCLACNGIYILIRALQTGNRSSGIRVLLFAEIYFVTVAAHDILIALGIIQSIALIFTGTLFTLGALTWITCLNFGDILTQNSYLAARLKKANKNLSFLNEKLESKVEEQTRDIKSILTNIEMGILTITNAESLAIGSDYSPATENLLDEGDLAGKNAINLIFANSNIGPDDVSKCSSVIGFTIGESLLGWDLNRKNLVSEICKTTSEGERKLLELDWSAVVDSKGIVEKVLVTIRDVTSIRQLQDAAINQSKELECIGEIVATSNKSFDNLIFQGRQLIDENKRLLSAATDANKETIKILFINMHTFKGLCRSLRMKNLTTLIHKAEGRLADLQKDPAALWDRNLLLADLQAVEGLFQKYVYLSEQKLNRRSYDENYVMIDRALVEENISNLEKVDGRLLSEDDRYLLARTRNNLCQSVYSNTSEVFSEILGSVGSLAADLGKDTPDINLDDPGFRVHADENKLKQIFLHIIRNSMDHGIESAPERVALGKAPQGTIHIALCQEGNEVLIRYQDDGRGLNLAKLRMLATTKRLLTEDELNDDAKVANLIFYSGLSTADTVSEISGRGIGMEAVKQYVSEVAGDIALEFLGPDAGDGFRPFRFVLRFSDLVSHSNLANAG
jgi:signal transduction histidine kinase